MVAAHYDALGFTPVEPGRQDRAGSYVLELEHYRPPDLPMTLSKD